MNWFTTIKRYFDKGFWTKDMVKVAVQTNKITEMEYKTITGDEYSA